MSTIILSTSGGTLPPNTPTPPTPPVIPQPPPPPNPVTPPPVPNPMCPTITIAPASLPGATVGVAYSQTFTASGGTSPYTFSGAGTLPPGLSLSSAGAGPASRSRPQPLTITVALRATD